MPDRTPPEPLRLPEANEFSPGQVELRWLLDAAHRHSGDRAGLVEEIRQKYFSASALRRTDPSERLRQQQVRASNVLIGMSGYGLYSLPTAALTDVGAKLRLANSDEELYSSFAAHILRNRNGLLVLRAVRLLQDQGAKVGKTTLQDQLEADGFWLPRATTYHTKLLGWLRMAGVVGDNYEIDDVRVGNLAGASVGTISEWTSLTDAQRAFARSLRQLAVTHGTSPISTSTVLDHAILQSGKKLFRADQVRAEVVNPLASHGWLVPAGTGPGRGGKSGTVSATQKLLDSDIEILAGFRLDGIPGDLRPLLGTPLNQLFQQLDSTNTHEKGIALELLTLRLVMDLGLTPTEMRVRGEETGGAEVDVVAEAAHLHFSRWLLQCKNTKTPVELVALQKEVANALLLQSQVIVMVTTGRFAGSIPGFQRQLAGTTHLQVVLVDGSLLQKYKDRGAAVLTAYFHEAARATLRVKRSQLGPVG